MKKKGLIIATIVMVLVLAVSLTTATYAWFTAATTTSIEGFNVEITANNAVDIGMKSTYGMELGVTTDDFKTGDVTFTPGTAGVLGGSWSGDSSGLSASLTHDILWGSQSKAVGVTNTAASTSTTISDYGTVAEKFGANYTINSANLGYSNATPPVAILTDVSAAKANKDNTNNGDYVHFILGAMPNRALSANNLVIMLDMTSSTASTVGIMSSLHIAYRITKAGDASVATTWTEIDLFGTTHYGAQKSTLASNQWDSNATTLGTASAAIQTAYTDTYTGSYPTASVCAVIGPLSTAQNDIDQIELVIYIAGSDSDCNNSGLGSSGAIKLFFQTVDAV